MIDRPEDLIFGYAPNPIKTPRGLTIGGGIVYPELNRSRWHFKHLG